MTDFAYPRNELTAFTFEPGDGTVYRAIFAPVGPAATAAAYVGQEGVFFAFGTGNKPVTGYFFHRDRRIDFGYFYEKMQGCADGYLTTVYIGWLTLLLIFDRELPEQLPCYSDKHHERLQNWYESLDTDWADVVRRMIAQADS